MLLYPLCSHNIDNNNILQLCTAGATATDPQCTIVTIENLHLPTLLQLYQFPRQMGFRKLITKLHVQV